MVHDMIVDAHEAFAGQSDETIAMLIDHMLSDLADEFPQAIFKTVPREKLH